MLFWHGHFVVSNTKVGSYDYMLEYYKTLASLGPGPFEPFCQAMANETAMLLYLDNDANTKNAPQENFARELMELFVLGVNRGYGQADVREAAKAWTGYGLRWDDTLKRHFPFYNDRNHDGGQKTIFGITKAWTGPQVIEEMCRGSRSQTAAEHLATKLWSFFAYEKPDSGLVASLAADYLAVGLNTLEFLKRMFKRAEFYSDRALQGRIKSPIEWGAMILASTGLKAADMYLTGTLGRAGQDLFRPPNVAGWKLNTVWLNESTFWELDNVAESAGFYALYDSKKNPSSRASLQTIPDLSVPAAVDLVAKTFGLQTLSTGTRQSLERWLTDVRSNNDWGQGQSLMRLVALSTEARMA